MITSKQIIAEKWAVPVSNEFIVVRPNNDNKENVDVICGVNPGIENAADIARALSLLPEIYSALQDCRQVIKDSPPDWQVQWDMLGQLIKIISDSVEGNLNVYDE